MKPNRLWLACAEQTLKRSFQTWVPQRNFPWRHQVSTIDRPSEYGCTSPYTALIVPTGSQRTLFYGDPWVWEKLIQDPFLLRSQGWVAGCILEGNYFIGASPGAEPAGWWERRASRHWGDTKTAKLSMPLADTSFIDTKYKQAMEIRTLMPGPVT